MSCIIIGASHAGVQAAISLRSKGYTESITLISNEAVLPYQRPPLSKGFLQNNLSEQKLWLRPETFYQQKDINLMLGEEVVSIDRDTKQVTLKSKITLDYDELILATGAKVRALAIPGADLPGIYYLRQYQDAQRIRDHLDQVNRVVVIGGGYIGLEAAASFAKLGKQVTVLVQAERPLSKTTSPLISDYLTQVHQDNGVEIHTGVQANSITKSAEGLMIQGSNGKAYQADMLVVGIGVVAEQTLAQDCGLEVDKGVCVNQYQQTSDSNIYAIGDCARFFHSLYKASMRIESVQNATDQAKTVAATILGEQIPYGATAWFWSDQYAEKMQMAGLSAGYDESVVRQEAPNSFAVFYLAKQQLIAVDTMNQPKTFMVTRKHLATLPRVDKTILADVSQDLSCAFLTD
jgi:3-phenylpropionate/trans-cinnamate dioxygenase ferredoxin reductase subunit